MTSYFRFYYEDEDMWLYLEVDEQGWALRHVELVGPETRPVTAASLQEVLELRDHADLAAMRRYEDRYGVLTDANLEGWQGQPGAASMSADDFQGLWARARQGLDDHHR